MYALKLIPNCFCDNAGMLEKKGGGAAAGRDKAGGAAGGAGKQKLVIVDAPAQPTKSGGCC